MKTPSLVSFSMQCYRGRMNNAFSHTSMLCVLLVVLAGGCTPSRSLTFETVGAQATSVEVYGIQNLHRPSHDYDTIWLRPLDLARAHGTDGSEYIFMLPDHSNWSAKEVTPTAIEAASARVPGCTYQIRKVGADSAAHEWNLRAKRANRIPMGKPPQKWWEPYDPQYIPDSNDCFTCMVTYTITVQPDRVWQEDVLDKYWIWIPYSKGPTDIVLCRYKFWFEHGQCIQAEISTWERSRAVWARGGKAVDGFMPEVGVRTHAGNQMFRLPINEDDLHRLYIPRNTINITK